jgi:hypothetical protein
MEAPAPDGISNLFFKNIKFLTFTGLRNENKSLTGSKRRQKFFTTYEWEIEHFLEINSDIALEKLTNV